MMTNAEKICRKLRTGSIENLPELSKLGLRCKFWHKVVHHKKELFKNAKCLQSTANVLEIISCNVPLVSTIVCLKKTKNNYLHFKKKKSVLRDKFIKLNPKKKEDLKALRKKEKLKEKWKKHKLTFGK